MKTRHAAPNVWFAKEKKLRLTRQNITQIAAYAGRPPSGRARLCAHSHETSRVHEMFITLGHGAYVRPHLHKTRDESYLILEGSAVFYTFSARGQIRTRTLVGDYRSNDIFYYRQNPGEYHGLLILSKKFIFLEIRPGPLNRRDSYRAPWAPVDTDVVAAKEFVQKLGNDWNKFCRRQK